MSTLGSFDAPIEIFGGLVTDMSPADLPHGVSPDCQDVIFSSGGVATRPGLAPLFGPLAGNPTVNYVKTYETLNATLRTLALDSNGVLYKETTPGTLATVASGLAANAYANSATLFGREYLAISDGKTGNDLPRQFDDTNFDRVSQSGPGAGPTVVDENVIVAITASPNGATQPSAVTIAASPTGATENGFLVTITTTAAHGLSTGQSVTISGVGVSGYNGTFPIVAAPSTTTFTYIAGASGLAASGAGTAASATATIQTTAAHGFVVGQLVTTSGIGVAGYNGTFVITAAPDSTHFTFTANTGGLAASGGGTAAAAGSVAAGVHQVCVIFKTRQGYLTAPGPATKWAASGGKRAVVTNIPTGPGNVVGRILCFTGAGGASFFYTAASGLPAGQPGSLFSGNMVIADNTTTSLAVDFSDAILLAGTNVDNLFRLVELSNSAGVIDYSQRLFWWGERNKMNNWLNLGFDGGFTGPSLPHYPLGWTPDSVFAPGGTDEESFTVWGAAYSIVGNGSTPTRGLMTQPAVQDALGAPLIRANTDYTIRARCARNAALLQGTLHLHLFSAGGGINTTGLQLTAAQLTTSYVEYTAQLTAPLATIPSDLLLRVYADGTPTQFGQFYLDSIEIFPTTQPVNASLVRASRVEDPESYDGIDGLLSVAENNGQAIRAAFKLRERLYFVKEHSLYATQDDGTNEPALWSIAEISRRVGTPSVRGVGIGEDWVVIAHRTGLYIFNGGEPIKISQEIQPTWNQINWQFGHTLWVTVDTKERRILIGAPLGAATSPNKILMLDYRDLDDAQDIAGRPPINITLTGRKTANDKTRKWSPWTIAANSCAQIERTDGTAIVVLGGGTPGVGGGGATGRIYQLSDTQLSDNGTAIPSYYTTHYFPERAVEQALELGAHRKLFSYLTMFVEGAGNLSLTSFTNSPSAPQAQQPLPLSSPSVKDLELPINILGERVAFQVATSQPGAWFRLQKFTPSVRPDPWSPVRGLN
ncbi:MAG TPA: hypothetical protein VOA78_11230 [Candidatus Dormibacteraeota bacterium]|nr:hypothetical protein [Candidatus Dormibacteraeota bacterium]